MAEGHGVDPCAQDAESPAPEVRNKIRSFTRPFGRGLISVHLHDVAGDDPGLIEQPSNERPVLHQR